MSAFKKSFRQWAGIAAGVLALGFAAQVAQAAGQQISRAIAKEMTAAQKALQSGQWAEALKNLDAAETKSGLTAFDRTTIADFKGFAYSRQSNYKAAQQAYEQALSGGAYTAEQTAKTTRIVFRLAAGNQQYAKAIEYGKKVYDGGQANADDLSIMGQTYYLDKNCKDAVIWIDRAITATRKAGDSPKEAMYQMKLRCAFDANDTPGTMTALEELVRITNKSEYWNQLIRFMRQDERDDHNLLMVYRVMFNTNSMNAGSDYVEMSQLLLDAALPGEAQMVLEKSFSSNMITADQKDRTTRILNAAKQRADVDRKGLPQLETESAKNPAGEADIKLGEVYYGFGDYPHAVAAIQRGIAKGQVKHLDEAYVYLGLSEAALKNGAEAHKAFAALKSVPNMSPRVLKLWELYSEKEI